MFCDTKSPPSQTISNVHLTLTSSLTYHKLVTLVSYTKIFDSIESVICPVNNDSNKTSGHTIYDICQQQNILFLAVPSVITLLATVIICIALKQTSSKPQTSFTAHLPPSSQPSSPASPSPHQLHLMEDRKHQLLCGVSLEHLNVLALQPALTKLCFYKL